MKDNEAVFDGDWIGVYGFVLNLGDAFPRFYGDLVGLHTSPMWIEYGAAIGDVELPSVPWTAEDLTFASPPVFAGRGRKGHAFDRAKAKWCRLVGTDVAEGIETTMDIEDTNGASFHFYDSAPSGW